MASKAVCCVWSEAGLAAGMTETAFNVIDKVPAIGLTGHARVVQLKVCGIWTQGAFG